MRPPTSTNPFDDEADDELPPATATTSSGGGSRRRPAPRGPQHRSPAAASEPQHYSRYRQQQDTHPALGGSGSSYDAGAAASTSTPNHSNANDDNPNNASGGLEPIWTARGVEWPLPSALRPSASARLLRSVGHVGVGAEDAAAEGGDDADGGAAAAGTGSGAGGADAPSSGNSGGGYGISSYLKGWTGGSAGGGASSSGGGSSGYNAEEDGA